LAEFLRVNASEVINLLTAEFKMEEAVKVWKEEGIEIGMERGMERGIEIGMEKGMEKGIEKGMEKGIEKGMEKGIEKGMERGMEKGKFEVARRMLARRMSVSDIVEMTGLNEKDVLSL
jgi:flagellar biosynthesis/type III secretory pathway protein FliH